MQKTAINRRETSVTTLHDPGTQGNALVLIQKVLSVGVDGAGSFKNARQIADEHLAQHGSREVAINRLIATHQRMIGVGGFALGRLDCSRCLSRFPRMSLPSTFSAAVALRGWRTYADTTSMPTRSVASSC